MKPARHLLSSQLIRRDPSRSPRHHEVTRFGWVLVGLIVAGLMLASGGAVNTAHAEEDGYGVWDGVDVSAVAN